jgi:hypothetical protein
VNEGEVVVTQIADGSFRSTVSGEPTDERRTG